MALSLTSRSALRTLNVENKQKNIQAQKSSTSAVKTSLFRDLASEGKGLSFAGCSKPGLKVHADPAPVKVKADVKQKVITKVPEPLPDIEKLHICNPEDEIKPMVDEKAEGMLRRLRKWGFTCLYPRRRLDSDSESEDEVALPETDPVLDLEEVDYYAIQDLSDIEVDNLTENVPSIDDLPIPFLDDSLDIEPNMGTLEVWDASTPLTMSPSVRENSTVQEQESATNGDSNASL